MNLARGVVFFVLAAACHAAAAQSRFALLIGIDHYNNGPVAHPADAPAADAGAPTASRFELPSWTDLDGAGNDVDAMLDMLVHKFGYPERNITVLKDAQATNQAIRQAMQRVLVDERKPGDEVVFYFAGHGSVRASRTSQKEGGYENTIVGSDANTGAFDVLDREVRTVFSHSVARQVRLTAIFDSCHSGTIARGLHPAKARWLGYDSRPVTDPMPAVPAAEDQPTNPALVISAAAQNQLAEEYDGGDKPHGAFTSALLDALRELPPDVPASDVFQGVTIRVQSMAADQVPVISRNARLHEPLFERPGTQRATLVTVTAVDDTGIALNTGYLSNIGPGSELVSAGKQSDVRLRIMVADGPDHAKAQVIPSQTNGAPAAKPHIQPGDQFRLVLWRPVEQHDLKVWIPPALSEPAWRAALQQAAQLSASKDVTWVRDPAQVAARWVLDWDGRSWQLTDTQAHAQQPLGAVLQASDVLSRVKDGQSLLVDFPPSVEAARNLRPQADDPVSLASDPQQAQYLLVGVIDGASPHYAWVRRESIEEGMVASSNSSGSMLCSANSAYPIRTSWADADAPGVDTLHRYELSLARIHAWLTLPAPPETQAASFPYHLRLVDSASSQPIDADGQEKGGMQFVTVGPTRALNVAAIADGPVSPILSPRYVYVMGIDCHGEGSLFVGREEDKLLPQSGDTEPKHVFRSTDWSTFDFSNAPDSIETFIMITTARPIADLSAFEFSPVLVPEEQKAAGAAQRGVSPLDRLLRSTHDGRRGDVDTPPDWSVEYLELKVGP